MNFTRNHGLVWLGAALLLALASPVSHSFAQAIASSTQAQPDVVTWDGENSIALNTLIGADTFYNVGIFGQATVTANVEAGLVWSGHETTSTLYSTYVAPGASGEVDAHATAVASVLAGYNPNADPYNYPYYQLGIAPLTQLSSGAIATNWYNAPDPTTGQQTVYFNITPQTFYSAYNYYFSQPAIHNIVSGDLSYQFLGPTDVINSSWGYSDPAGTDPYTMAADGFARAYPLTTLVVAAGNSTTAANPSDTVGGPASGYNSISVGAVGNYTYNQFNSVADFSSRGPSDYYDPVHGLVQSVRASVDLVAPGTSIMAAFYGGQTGGNGAQLSTTVPDPTGGAGDWYSFNDAGTSFAAPMVAGGVSLLKSTAYLTGMDSNALDTRVIKAVLMNSATKLPGWNNGQSVDANGVVVTTQSLDWAQGAGMLNLTAAFTQYLGGTQGVPGGSGGLVAKVGWDLGAITLGSFNDYTIDAGLFANSTFDVTLDWFRDLGPPVFTDNADPTLQTLTTSDDGFANLDLQVWNADFTHLFASSESIYNNVQELHFTLPEDGDYGIRVLYASQAFGTPEPEEYGLAWNVTDVPEPSISLLFSMAGVAVLAFRRKKA